MIVNRDDLKRFISGSPSGGDMTFDCFREAKRTLMGRITIEHDNNMMGNKQPPNRALRTLCGDKVADRFRGPLVAHCYKYRMGDEGKGWDLEDWGLGFRPLIPVDLGMASLPPILSFLKWRATSTDEYELEVEKKGAKEGGGGKGEEDENAI
ncbi:hypothetical protein N0V83_001240 [Neocucurbitaria cava]|uniref:Uncharacterized protein n=1 Tax=Neocucurbitaria cava TaxID=798079 RepID=A0A9W8YEX4_9PLEO|nr:hypothetical protein N0V83_001240 [Neocucurbitaria cava]